MGEGQPYYCISEAAGAAPQKLNGYLILLVLKPLVMQGWNAFKQNFKKEANLNGVGACQVQPHNYKVLY